MDFKNNYIFLFIVILVAGCDSYTSNHDDLARFLKQVDSYPTEAIEEVEQISVPQKKEYIAIKRRSPFADPLNYTIVNDSKSKIIPDMNRKKSDLETFDLGSFVMLGSLSDNNERWALVRVNNNNQIYNVKVGDYLGKNHGKIIQIKDSDIQLIEIVPIGKSWMERNSIIKIKNK